MCIEMPSLTCDHAYVSPFVDLIGNGFLPQDDNARPDRVRIAKHLQHQIIQRMEWPPLSLELNLIEHVWDE